MTVTEVIFTKETYSKDNNNIITLNDLTTMHTDVRDKSGNTYLMYGAIIGDLEIVSIQATGQSYKNQQLSHKETNNDIEELNLSVNIWANVDARNNEGKTALIHAVENNHLHIVKFLLGDLADHRFAMKADMYITNNNGKSATDIAFEYKHMDIFYYLIKCLID